MNDLLYVRLPLDVTRETWVYLRVDSIVAITDSTYKDRVDIHYAVGAERRSTTVAGSGADEVMQKIVIQVNAGGGKAAFHED